VAKRQPQRPTDARRERTMATRRRMIETAYKLFCERGYGVPLTDIAEAAGVAVQTLYFTFHTKAALFLEAFDFAVTGDVLGTPPDQQAWAARMAAEPDPRNAMRIMVDGAIGIFERVAPLTGVIKNTDEELAAAYRHREQLRLEGYGRQVSALAKRAKLRRGLNVDEATDIVFALFSPELYQVMVSERGWSTERWRRWVGETLGEALFG
jgi:AcrR family transcriptional regulator